METNAHALARYAAVTQEQGLVPIVEPEVLMDGTHGIARTEEVTGQVLERVFRQLRLQRVTLERMLLKPNMVVPGAEAKKHATVEEVADATLRVLRRHVPVVVPGIVFLSGGQDARPATEHLNAINARREDLPWRLTFSYGRALQDPAMEAWGGRTASIPAAQQALSDRARCNSAAALGNWNESMETGSAVRPSHS
jgi:fructose-bisphosphate aldolase class I